MSRPITRCCPACGSSKFHARIDGFKCEKCDHRFERPHRPGQYSQNGTGIITPLSFRAQMIREILAANAEAAQRVNDKKSQTYFGKTHKKSAVA